MIRFIIDVNLPYRFSIWNGDEFIHQVELGDSWTDSEIWSYAKENRLTIISKDADFSDRIMMEEPPPKVIHIKLGNMKISDMYALLHRNWNTILELNRTKN